MRTTLLKLCRAAALCLLASIAAAAQDAPAKGRLVLQTRSFEGGQPGYDSVPGHYWALFKRVGTPRPRASGDMIHSVDVATRADGERVEIKVGLRVGRNHDDRVEELATYYLSPGETVIASELEREGIAPFVFTVLRVVETDSAAPPVYNMTQSVAAAVADFSPTPLPHAKLVIRNISAKGIRAVQLREIMGGGRNFSTGFAFGEDGGLLMRPGASVERRVGVVEGHATQTEFSPRGLEGVTVAAVVFDDYSYEGDVEAAATCRSFDEGSRVQLPRLLALIREADAAPGAETPEAVRALAAKLAALDDDAPRPSVDAVLNAYPELSPAGRLGVGGGIQARMHRTRRELLDDLERFEKKFRDSPAENSFKAWLKAKQERYEAWLARL